jgi:hypothetical protein
MKYQIKNCPVCGVKSDIYNLKYHLSKMVYLEHKNNIENKPHYEYNKKLEIFDKEFVEEKLSTVLSTDKVCTKNEK